MIPGACNRLFVDRTLGGPKFGVVPAGHKPAQIEPNVALALLFGVVKRMRVQE